MGSHDERFFLEPASYRVVVIVLGANAVSAWAYWFR